MMAVSFMAQHGATLVDNGYHVLPIIPGEKAPGQFAFGRWEEMSDWTRFCERAPTEHELPIWEGWPDAGIGIACGRIVGLDIDVLDPALSAKLEQIARDMIDGIPAVRFGQRPKRMLVYRCDEMFESFNAGPLQVMAAGRQFVAHGVHPVTRAPYEWPEGNLTELDREQLPLITRDQARAWAHLGSKELGLEWPPRHAPAQRAGDREPGTRAAVEQALLFIRSDCSYPEWRDIGMAIKAGLGEDGCDLWHSWSARDDSRYDAKTCDRQWVSFHNDRPGGIGIGTLYERAQRGGWVPAGVDLYASCEAAAKVEINVASIIASAERGGGAVVEHLEPVWTVPAGEPGWLRDLSGGMRAFVDYANASAKSRQPWLAMGAALSCFGVLAGRRYAGPTDVRTNIYAVGIADSTGGKDHPLRCIEAVLVAADQGRLIAGSNIASGAAMFTALQQSPSCIVPTDEIGFMFSAVADRKRAPKHSIEIIDNLTKLYSCAPHLYHGTIYADAKLKPKAPIHQPNFCLYGVSTPQVFWSALSSAHVQDGSLARIILFESDNPFPDRQRLRSSGVPTDLEAWARGVAAGAEGHEAFPSGNIAEMAPRPYRVPYENAAAERVAFDMEDYGIELCRAERKRDPGSSLTSIMGRMAENTFKVALVRAVANNPASPMISKADLEWAYDLVDMSARAIMSAVANRMADNEREADLKALLRLIVDAGAAGMDRTELNRKMGRLYGKPLDEALTHLLDGEQVYMVEQPRTDGKRGGRARRTYYAN